MTRQTLLQDHTEQCCQGKGFPLSTQNVTVMTRQTLLQDHTEQGCHGNVLPLLTLDVTVMTRQTDKITLSRVVMGKGKDCHLKSGRDSYV